MGSAQLGVRLMGDDVTLLTGFLCTLTGRQPRVENPILPPSSGATPRPELLVRPPG